MATEQQPDGSLKDVPYSAVQYVRERVGLQVCAIATLDDLLGYLSKQTDNPAFAENHARVSAYRERYGVNA